jgi:ABC-2 type transport system permease protein
MISALILKDLKLFFRNQFFAVITFLGLAFFIAIYYVMPAKPDDTLPIALVLPGEAKAQYGEFLVNAIEADMVDSESELLELVKNGDYQAGLVLTDEMINSISQGNEVSVPVYTAPGTTPELRQAFIDIFTVAMNNISFSSTSTRINIQDNVTVLGPDLLGIGQPISLRSRMLPIMLMMIFSIELIGMANLISEEGERGTASALLVTPLSLSQFFTSKMIISIGMAFVEVLILVTATGRLFDSPLLLIVALLIGSLMITGLAFLIATFARNFMAVLAWSTLILMLLSLPGVTVMFPTLASSWIKLIPSYYLVDTLNRVLNYQAGWGQIALSLITLLVCGVIAMGAGSILLRRRFQ